MTSLTERIRSNKGKMEDVILLQDVANNIKGKTLCALGEFSTEAVISAIERFPEDFDAQVNK